MSLKEYCDYEGWFSEDKDEESDDKKEESADMPPTPPLEGDDEEKV